MAACSEIPALEQRQHQWNPLDALGLVTDHSPGHHVDAPTSSHRQTLVIMLLDLACVTGDRRVLEMRSMRVDVDRWRC